MSPALAGRFLTSVPPGKSHLLISFSKEVMLERVHGIFFEVFYSFTNNEKCVVLKTMTGTVEHFEGHLGYEKCNCFWKSHQC